MRVAMVLATAGVTTMAGAVAAAPAAADAVPGQLVVGFEREVPAAKQRAVIEDAGGSVIKRLASIRGNVVRVRTPGLALAVLRRRLEGRDLVRYAEPDHYVRASVVPNDPLYAFEYPLATSGPAAIGAPAAWGVRQSCAKIAVLDTGTQTKHPDLTGNVWKNSKEVAGNGKDDDDNGYVDDYYGADVLDHRGSGEDENGHGTHVAGTIAGVGNNGIGVSGLCWTAPVMSVKFMDAKGRGSSSDSVAALDYAVRQGAKVVNGSFGSSSKSSALADEVAYAQSKGVLCVFAAGNDGANNDTSPMYPASLTNSNIISVAAVTSTGALASFSNFGAVSVDLGAPGEGILSTYIGSEYKVLDGTSMAAPSVAAAAAMLRSHDSDLTYKEIRSAILSHTTATTALNGKVVKPGVLDVAAALASVG